MPTRIILQGTLPRSNQPALSSPVLHDDGAYQKPVNAQSPASPSTTSLDRVGNARRRSTQRSMVGFRSSFLREFSNPDEQEPERIRLSTDDIRASPRLLGYLFSMIAGGVLLVSISQFYREEIETVDEDIDRDKYFVFTNGLVFRWKLWGAIYVSAIGVGLCLLTVVLHFDTIFFPKTWVNVFRDGSLSERNWILFLMLVWAAGLHVSTSSLSVGETQANVFFTTWIAFGASALNFGVWRESAGFTSLADTVNQHRRETTYNWMWTGIFSIIFAGSATDIYINREEIELRLKGEKIDLDTRDWTIVLCVVWAEVAVCIMAVVFNEWFNESSSLPFTMSLPSGRYRCDFGWWQVEGLLALFAVVAKFWFILVYTGVDGVINGLSNAYFGAWGSFFNSVFTLGTWIRENKNIEYVVKESDTVRRNHINRSK